MFNVKTGTNPNPNHNPDSDPIRPTWLVLTLSDPRVGEFFCITCIVWVDCDFRGGPTLGQVKPRTRGRMPTIKVGMVRRRNTVSLPSHPP